MAVSSNISLSDPIYSAAVTSKHDLTASSRSTDFTFSTCSPGLSAFPILPLLPSPLLMDPRNAFVAFPRVSLQDSFGSPFDSRCKRFFLMQKNAKFQFLGLSHMENENMTFSFVIPSYVPHKTPEKVGAS